MPKRSVKPAGKCIFCQGGAVPGNAMSGEHLWSDWMRKNNLLPSGGEYEEFRRVMEEHSESVKSVFERVRQGSANTKTIKAVCQNCNQTWMSALETAAQKYLTPLIRGDSVTLDSRAQQTITEWLVMKVLVVEHNSYRGHPADPIFDQAACTTFMKSRTIPGAFDIWLSMQNSAKWVTGIYRFTTGLGLPTTDSLPTTDPPLPRPKTVQSVTWGMGKLLIYVHAFNDVALRESLQLNPQGPFYRLWPLTNESICWPPRFHLAASSIDALANALDDFARANARRDPEPS